jgi:hypothetical protein
LLSAVPLAVVISNLQSASVKAHAGNHRTAVDCLWFGCKPPSKCMNIPISDSPVFKIDRAKKGWGRYRSSSLLPKTTISSDKWQINGKGTCNGRRRFFRISLM